jgi:hypothetical protein
MKQHLLLVAVLAAPAHVPLPDMSQVTPELKLLLLHNQLGLPF